MSLHRQLIFAVAAMFSFQPAAFGVLITTHTDIDAAGAVVNGAIGANEYGTGNSYNYAGGGGGFGGTLGAGTLYMQSDLSNLYVGFQPGNSLNDNVVIHMDTRSGGFSDAQMNDVADPGRNLLSNLTRDVDDPFPVGFSPDYGLVIGSFGIVLFELNAGNTPGHLNFLQFDGTFSGNNPGLAREIAIPRSNLGNPSGPINFLVSYGSDTNFMSNESMPAEVFNAGANPGFDNNGTNLPVVREFWHQFIMVPEPSSVTLLGIAALAGLRWRQRRV